MTKSVPKSPLFGENKMKFRKKIAELEKKIAEKTKLVKLMSEFEDKFQEIMQTPLDTATSYSNIRRQINQELIPDQSWLDRQKKILGTKEAILDIPLPANINMRFLLTEHKARMVIERIETCNPGVKITSVELDHPKPDEIGSIPFYYFEGYNEDGIIDAMFENYNWSDILESNLPVALEFHRAQWPVWLVIKPQ